MKRDLHILKRFILGGAIALALLVCFGVVVVQSASAGNRLQESDNFGIGNERFSIEAPVGVIYKNDFETEGTMQSGHTSLATFCTRDISLALSSISFKLEMAAQAAAQAARADELIKINIAKNKRISHEAIYGMPSGLSEVNWDQGKEAFINEWTARLNLYFAESPMENTGTFFANAAWNNGIDPRFSAAISNTESSKGYACFASHNAWGWGDSSWSSWEEAINEHVNGLATMYGYTITRQFAEKYCPPNSDNWFNNTLSEMLII